MASNKTGHKSICRLLSLAAAASVSISVSTAARGAADGGGERVWKDDKGRIRVTPVAIPEADKNTWPADWEEALHDRANESIVEMSKKANGKYGNVYFENEKQAYPSAMLDFLGGNRKPALQMLQSNDSEGYNKYTNMVDFYPCFTLKGQMRKYYFFGPFLSDAYREKFKEGAKIWTETDPAKRPMAGMPKDPNKRPGDNGWMPDATGASVDTRSTDNLRAMREVSVYLMAEETGNKAVADLYKGKIHTWSTTLYQVGMGEWDSNNYLHHTFTAYLNLYDFAKDEQTRRMGKGVLDCISASAALKYWRGDFGGPSKRDYGGKLAYGTNAAVGFAYYFDDSPAPVKHDRDDVHTITSWYRPPAAVMNLAHKNFAKPVEIFATKPKYDAWNMKADEGPANFETQYIANTYQLGSLTKGSEGDQNGFKLMAFNSKRGADDLYLSTAAGTDPKAISTGSAGGDEVVQYRNMAIFVNPKPGAPFHLFLPKSAQVEQQGSITFIKFEKTWLALHAINVAATDTKTEVLEDKKAAAGSGTDEIIDFKGTQGAKLSGFAMELGEQESLGDYAAFKAAVSSKARLDLSGIAEGAVGYTGAGGDSIRMTYVAGDQPKLWRNGKEQNWKDRWALWEGAPDSPNPSPISMGWRKGTLHVSAGGVTFEGTLTPEGDYAFNNK